MRAGATWNDISLLNLSARGALAQSAAPPANGTYVEVRRGAFVIVGRIVWTEGNRFGLRAQDTIPVTQIIAGPSAPVDDAFPRPFNPDFDRRTSARKLSVSESHERSRQVARLVEYSFFAGAVLLFSTMTFSVVQTAMARPMAKITAALDSE